MTRFVFHRRSSAARPGWLRENRIASSGSVSARAAARRAIVTLSTEALTRTRVSAHADDVAARRESRKLDRSPAVRDIARTVTKDVTTTMGAASATRVMLGELTIASNVTPHAATRGPARVAAACDYSSLGVRALHCELREESITSPRRMHPSSHTTVVTDTTPLIRHGSIDESVERPAATRALEQLTILARRRAVGRLTRTLGR